MSAWAAIDPEDFDYWTEGDEGYTWRSNRLPVDEWQCADCGETIGWVMAGDDDVPDIHWRPIHVKPGFDLFAAGTLRVCEGCAA